MYLLRARRALAASAVSLCLVSCAGSSDHPGQGGAGGATSDGGTTTGKGGSSSGLGGGSSSGMPAQGAFAKGMSVTDVEVNQGVGIAVVTAGALVAKADRTAPIVGQRHGMVRVSWALEAGFAPRDIEAQVTLTDGKGKSTILTQTKMVSGPPDLTRLDGTFHWDIDGSMIDGGTTFSVELHETSGSGDAMPGAARFPASGAADLGAIGDAMPLNVVILPANLKCQSISPPSLQAADKSIIESQLWNLYPISSLDITYHAPVTLDVSPCGDNAGILDAISTLRDSETLGDDVYYHAIFANDPSDPFQSGGYSWLLTSAQKGDERVGFSVDFAGGLHNNVAHEIGHSHGRPHTYSDPSYVPSGAAQQGCGRRAEYGYGVYPGQHAFYHDANDYPPMKDVLGWLIPPTDSLGLSGNTCDGFPGPNAPPALDDVMSYAYPYWVGAYTYAAFAARIQALAALEKGAAVHHGERPTSRVLSGTFLGDGTVQWRVRPKEVPATLPLDASNRARLELPGSARDLPIVHKLGADGRIGGFDVPLPEDVSTVGATGLTAIVGGRAIHAQPAALREALRFR